MKFDNLLKNYLTEEDSVEKVELDKLKEKHMIPITDEMTDELSDGIEAEKEHSNLYDFLTEYLEDKDIEFPFEEDEFYEWIAAPHLKESPEYYSKLSELEKTFKKDEEDKEDLEDIESPLEEE